MYWNNPLETVKYPSDSDIIFKSMHNGAHCLFYDPAVDKTHIHNQQTLQDLCDWFNRGVAAQGWHDFFSDPRNHYDLANLVKLNLWVHDLPIRGSIKPMLLNYSGTKYNSNFDSGTGASRLRAMERIPSMQTVSAFITTSCDFQSRFAHLESVSSFNRFAELCGAVVGQEFLFRLTDPSAPFGIDWYEYNSQHTAAVTPNESACLVAFERYFNQHPEIILTPDWFDSVIAWDYT